MNTDEVIHKTLALAQSQLSNYRNNNMHDKKISFNMVYDTGVNPIRTTGENNNIKYYAVGQFGLDLAGPFPTEEEAIQAVETYILHHPADTPENGKPLLLENP